MSGETAIVTQRSALSMQVCVAKDWADEQVTEFANLENPAGTECGWVIRRQGDKALAGDPERKQCGDDCDRVHIMLDC